jgi:hypothetical protein
VSCGRGSEKRTRLDVNGRVVRVRDGESKLSADVPPFRRLLITVVEVDRDHVVRLPIRVAHRKEEDVPTSEEKSTWKFDEKHRLTKLLARALVHSGYEGRERELTTCAHRN